MKPKQYILDFEQLGLGMFVHWGLYSQLGRGEWVYFTEKMNMEEYKKLKDTFTAEDFDAEELVMTAKNAGFKYITLTTRHHEGFSLYDTKGLNDFDAPHSPAGRDLVREFADACRRHDIMPVFYHTTLDWYNKDFENDFDKYLEYLKKSVEILCTNYGKIGGMWFDGNWSKPDADWREDELYSMIHSLQPDAIIVNNTGLSKPGVMGAKEIDVVTYENSQATPIDRSKMEKYIAGEMNHTINDHWGYGANDINYKAPGEIIESLCNCRKVGANYLMNIGPEGQGAVNSYQKELLKLVGRWMNVFGEAIYNGRPYYYANNDKSFILKSIKGDKLYIFVFDLGTVGSANVIVGGKYIGSHSYNNIKDKVLSVKWIDNGEQLDYIQDENMLCIYTTGYPYGTSYRVRVAEAVIESPDV